MEFYDFPFTHIFQRDRDRYTTNQENVGIDMESLGETNRGNLGETPGVPMNWETGARATPKRSAQRGRVRH